MLAAAVLARPAVAEIETPQWLRQRFQGAGQGHLFDRWEERSQSARANLIASLRKVELKWLDLLLEQRAAGRSGRALRPTSTPPSVLASNEQERSAFHVVGFEELRRGSCACLTVAGGQGTRLGISGPKGVFPITPIRRASLFQVFAEKLLAARKRYAAATPWYIMTSPLNHQETVAFFEQRDFFGLPPGDVTLFTQGLNPVVDEDSKLVLAADGAIMLSPDGHGGVVKALRLAVGADGLAARGIRHLFYCQIDNPLLTVPDPVFLGAHLRRRSQLSTKVIARRGPEEKMGVACVCDGAPHIVEYSDIDPLAAAATDADGRLVFRYGSIGAHLMEVPHLFAWEPCLPLHLARKLAEVLVPDATGASVVTKSVTKFEQFVFDAIPACERSLFIESDRTEEFAPLKNSSGDDSVATCIAGQSRKFQRWLSRCGVEVSATTSAGTPLLVEIAATYADSPAELQIRLQNSVTRINADSLFE